MQEETFGCIRKCLAENGRHRCLRVFEVLFEKVMRRGKEDGGLHLVCNASEPLANVITEVARQIGEEIDPSLVEDMLSVRSFLPHNVRLCHLMVIDDQLKESSAAVTS